MSTTRGTEKENKEGAREINVESVNTVDYRSLPGKEGQEPEKNDIHVVHLTKKGRDSGGGGLAGAAAAVTSGVQTAKDKLFGVGKDDSHKTNE